MAARDEQQQIRKSEGGIDQAGAQRMAFEMVDRDQRLAGRERESLAGEQRHHHPADQPGPGRRGDRIHVVDRQPGLGQHLADQVRQYFDMRARGDLRHHPAVGLMGAVLADHHLGENPPVRRHQRRGAVIA